jgi:gamma-glutamyltranspeptidase/glutathione hydrolase
MRRALGTGVALMLLTSGSTMGQQPSDSQRASSQPSSSSARPASTAKASAGAPLPIPGRSVIVTRDGIVATSQPLAARAGVEILERGGNAIDAAIATNAAMGLMEPTGNGIGGDLFAIIYDAKTGTLHGLNSSGWAPSGMTPAFLASKGHKTMPQRGIYSATVPGAVAGWQAMREKFGRLPFSQSLAPAIYYAEHGFPVAEITAAGWGRSKALLAAHPNSAKTYLVDGGRTPRFGEVFRNPDLATSLRRIVDKGRDGYYTGPTADAIVAISNEMGGTFTLADLAEFQPEWVTPIQTTYRGWTVSEIPPNGQGIAALMMLNLMEKFPLGDYGFHSPKALHVMIEAKKLAYADMLQYVGDPRFSKVPVSQMLDKTRAEARAGLIDAAKAKCGVSPSQWDSPSASLSAHPSSRAGDAGASKFESITSAQGNDTIYLTVIDRDGTIVSLIQSNYSGFGSGVVPKDAGFMLQNRGGNFTLEPGLANTLAPHKRPLHTIIPAFMEKDGVRIGFGIMGGWNQSQAHAQFVANIADYGMTIQQALEAGRFTKSTFDGCDLDIEELVPASTREALTALGHELKVIPRRTGTFGYGQAVMSDQAGVHYGASEPRHDGAAIPEAPPIFSAPAPSVAAAPSVDTRAPRSKP